MLYSQLKSMVQKAKDREEFVVNVKTDKCDVLIGGKNSKWRIPDYLKRAAKAGEKKHHVIMGYKLYIERRSRENPNFMKMLKKELKGKVLGCFCKPGICHGDILSEFANSEDTNVQDGV